MMFLTEFFKRINLTVIILGGLLFRIIFLFLCKDSDTRDVFTYLSSGKSFLAHFIIESNIVMPLFPIIAGLCGSIMAVKIFNLVIGTILIYAVYLLAKKISHSEKAGLIAAFLTAFYPFYIYHSVLALTEMSYTLLFVLTFYFLYKNKLGIASCLLVMSILIRPVLDPLAPVLIFYFAYKIHGLTLRKSFYKVLVYFSIYFLLMTPWWIHNYIKYGQFVRLNLAYSHMIYLGSMYLDTAEDKTVYAPIFKIKDPIAKNDSILKISINYIKNKPQRYLSLSYRKMKEFCRFWPKGKYSKYSIFIVAGSLPIFIFFGIFLLFDMRRQWLRVIPLIAVLLYFFIAHTLLYSVSRYRIPVDSFIIVMAAFAIWKRIDRNESGTKTEQVS